MNLLTGTFQGIGNSLARIFTERLKPRWIWFGVTDRCNSHCAHCNIWRKNPDADPLTLVEIERAFRNPLFSQLEYILNSGGEAVLIEDIEEILLVEHKVLPRAKLHLSTNGILAERVLEVVKTMIKNAIPIEVGISLDGIGEEHDRIRGVKGNFEKTQWLLRELIALRKAHKTKVFPLVGLTLTNRTTASFQRVKDFTKALNVPFSAQWYNQSSFYDNFDKKETDGRLQKEMSGIVRSLPCNLLNSKWIEWLAGKPIIYPCFALYTFCVLKCNGDIVPCLSLWDKKIGNVRGQDLMGLWRSAEAKEARCAVKDCQGCLNSWGVVWSSTSSPIHAMAFFLKRPKLAWKKIIETLKGA